MLNVESKCAAFAIWAVIAAIIVVAAWSLFNWPAPSVVWEAAIASETAKIIERFQMLLGLLLGFGSLAGVYLYDGHKERENNRAYLADQNSTLSETLAGELSELAIDCNAKAHQAWRMCEDITNEKVETGENLALPEELYRSIASPHDTALMDLSPEDLSSLGSSIYPELRKIRQELRYAEDLIEEMPIDSDATAEEQSSFFEHMARNYMGLAHACIHVKARCEGKLPHMVDCGHDHSPKQITSTIQSTQISAVTH